jgi:hypothetical protein
VPGVRTWGCEGVLWDPRGPPFISSPVPCVLFERSCSPKLKVIRSHFTASCACVTSQRSRHVIPIAVSPAPPSETSHGPCWTTAVLHEKSVRLAQKMLS